MTGGGAGESWSPVVEAMPELFAGLLGEGREGRETVSCFPGLCNTGGC